MELLFAFFCFPILGSYWRCVCVCPSRLLLPLCGLSNVVPAGVFCLVCIIRLLLVCFVGLSK